MHDSPISKTGFTISLIVSLLFAVSAAFSEFNDHSFVVFCDVGQGDASYIHLRPDIDILIDAGKGASVSNCLGKYMPANDRVIEMAFISHLQNDHYGGYLYLPFHYKIKQLFVSNTKTSSDEISKLLMLMKSKKVHTEILSAGDSLQIDKGELKMLWPTEDYIRASNNKNDPNEGSQVMVFRYNNRSILYTGDVSPKSLQALLQQSISKVDILKIPHHGSKNGLIEEFFLLADPTYSVISVGKNNSYGHPSSEILKMLVGSGTQILRTDLLGDIVFNLD